jgi:hypothetical protein
MKKVIIGECSYIYKKTKNKYSLIYDPNDKEWNEHVKGKIAYQVIDTGNGFKIKQDKFQELDYSEFEELKYLIKKIK